MLKLPNRFCRYLKVTCENVSYRPHVREFTQFTCARKPCCLLDPHTPTIVPSYHFGQHHLLFASFKKKRRIKIPSLNSNEPRKAKPMSGSFTPTLNHVSYGGQFDVSASSDNISMWHSQVDDSGAVNNVERKPLTLPPDFRVWEPVGKKSAAYDTGNTFKFKIISYNVLAQYLLECHPYLYTECSPKNLKWNVRAAHLYDEIIRLSPDILCLQEVQVSHLQSFYSKFEDIGYCGIFKQKTGHRQDGCAIYFKRSLFELMDQMSVEFYQPELPILNRDNIGMMVKLVPRSLPCAPFVVATTHLLYNPKRTDVRLAQTQVFLAEIDRFAYYKNGRDKGHLPIILTGDLNSLPDSAVIKLLDRGHVSASPFRDSSDWKRIGVTDNCQHLSVYLDRQEGKNTDFSTIKIQNTEYSGGSPCESACSQPGPPGCEHSELFNGGVLGHQLRLTSAYDTRKPDGAAEASTFQDCWVTVDYIYFSSCSSLRLVERLRLPTAAECEVLGALPNDALGSDHLALAAAFELRPHASSA